MVDWYGPTDFQIMDSCGSSFSHDAIESPESTLIGGLIQENDALCALANPMTYIDKSDPPFLIIHGDKDVLVPHCQSQIFYRRLQQNQVESELIIIPGGAHGGGITWQEQYVNAMIVFFKKHAKL